MGTNTTSFNADTEPYAIDRIDERGNIRQHMTRDGQRTICGLAIVGSQEAVGNGPCRRCAGILAGHAVRS